MHVLIEESHMEAESTEPLLHAQPSSPPRWKVFALLTAVALQNSASSVVRGVSRGTRNERFSTLEAQLGAEGLKLLACTVMCVHGGETDAICTGRLLHVLLPAVVYLIINVLSFWALQYIDAATFSVVAQGKLVATAACGLFVGRKYGVRKWLAILVVTLGALLVTGRAASTDNFNIDAGLAAALLEVCLSGVASVAFERVLKADTGSVWLLNAQLALCTLALGTPIALLGGSPLEGWTRLGGMCVLLSATGGILVAFSLKFSCAVSKSVATAASLVLTWCVTAFMSTTIDLVAISGCLVCAVGVIQYAVD